MISNKYIITPIKKQEILTLTFKCIIDGEKGMKQLNNKTGIEFLHVAYLQIHSSTHFFSSYGHSLE